MLNNEKNVNVHNPVQINVGQQENSIQYIIRKLKNLDIITTSRFANTFVVQWFKTGLFTICIAVPFIALWLFLIAEIGMYFYTDYPLSRRLAIPFLFIQELINRIPVFIELAKPLGFWLIVWGTCFFCVYLGTYVAAKIIYWNDKEKAKALHFLLFYMLGWFILLSIFTKSSEAKK